MVVLATLATVIASQAVISGAFSVSRQAVRLGFLPYLRIRHTSPHEVGQVYVPAVNWILFVGVLILMLGFRSSERLATAYGVAVTATFLITTALFLVVARVHWKWAAWKLVLAAVVIGGAELTYFAANLTKVAHGGWLPLLIAVSVFTIMTDLAAGPRARHRAPYREGGPAAGVRRARCASSASPACPASAVFPHPTKETTPLALRANVEHNHVVHEHVVIVSVVSENVPHVAWTSGSASTTWATTTTASCTSPSGTASRTNRTSRRHCGRRARAGRRAPSSTSTRTRPPISCRG